MLSQCIQWHIYLIICFFILYLKDIWFHFQILIYTAPWTYWNIFNIQFCLIIIHSDGMAGSCSTCVLKMIRNFHFALKSFWCSVHQGLLAKVLISWKHLEHLVVWHFHMFNFSQCNTSNYVFVFSCVLSFHWLMMLEIFLVLIYYLNIFGKVFLIPIPICFLVNLFSKDFPFRSGKCEIPQILPYL